VRPGARDVLVLAAVPLSMAGFYYCYVAGVVEENRAPSRAPALAFLLLGVWALVMLTSIPS
jgi:hypothetical protein